ncbi:hypothetical protein [Crenothrix sp.]|uniref:hypothetical protein n=1 Tax=Crenothrix sp. TaxID=3100433 RepID=UPI00374DC53A
MTQPLELQDTADKPTSSPLGQLNQLFHQEYQHWQNLAQQKIATGEIPVAIRLDDRLVLVLANQEHVYQINTDRYHELKALSHIPLAIYFIVARSPSDLHSLSAIKEQLAALSDILDALNVYTDPIRCALDELAESVSVNSGVLAYDAVKDFARHLKPNFQKLLAEAADDEITQLMAAMSAIKLIVGDTEQCAEMFLVICGGHQPRYKQISKQFFERWLRQETNSDTETTHRVIYAESCKTLDEAIKLVSTRIVSANLGEVFLHSPLSLDEDVLGNAGIAAMDRLLNN